MIFLLFQIIQKVVLRAQDAKGGKTISKSCPEITAHFTFVQQKPRTSKGLPVFPHSHVHCSILQSNHSLTYSIMEMKGNGSQALPGLAKPASNNGPGFQGVEQLSMDKLLLCRAWK